MPPGVRFCPVSFRRKEGTHICPGIVGATNWFSPSYNPNTGLFYVMALENCNLYFSKPKPFTPGETFYGTGTKLPPNEIRHKILLALSPTDGKKVWQYPQAGRGNSWGGTLTTAGGLVFFADDAESFEAVDAETGQPLVALQYRTVFQRVANDLCRRWSSIRCHLRRQRPVHLRAAPLIVAAPSRG